MAEALRAMRNDPGYLQETAWLDEAAAVELPDEEEQWWRK